jgi:2-polyprenyl-3-methyl-5-hydroxy-6-metoxy-1,4-benzoquinol methylase
MELSDIRPKKVVEVSAEAAKLDAEYLYRNIDKFFSRSCPACDQKEASIFGVKNKFNYVKCETCWTVYMNPAPSEDLLTDFYKNSENYRVWSEVVYPTTQETRWNTLHKSRSKKVWDSIEKFLPGSLLDKNQSLNYLEFGAGTGDTAKRIEFDKRVNQINVCAVEANSEMIHTLNEKEINVVAFEDLLESSQDIIGAFEVVEHLREVRSFFEIAHRTLKDNGLLIISTPNSLSLEVNILKSQSTTVDHEHISILSPVGLAICALDKGFSVKFLQSAGELDLELLAESNSIASNAVLIGDLKWGSQSDIADANLTSSLFAVFQKDII